MIHELTSQTTTQIGLRNAEILPKDFTSIQIHNKVFCIGGEKKENEIRTVVATDCFVINEQTYEAERRATEIADRRAEMNSPEEIHTMNTLAAAQIVNMF